MRYILHQQEVVGTGVLPDDLIRDVALKMTDGRGGVYLYGKCARRVGGMDIYARYKRPLTCHELLVELRDIGSPLALGKQVYDFDDLMALGISSEVQFVSLGQTMPLQVPVVPPKKVTRVECFDAAPLPNKRLCEYTDLFEVYAVPIPETLQKIYIPHPPGRVDQLRGFDALQYTPKAMTQCTVTGVRGSLGLSAPPLAVQVDLHALYKTLHASKAVPRLWLEGAPARRLKEVPSKPAPEGAGLWAEFVGGERARLLATGAVQFLWDDPTQPQALPHKLQSRLNSLLAWVNGALEHGGPRETDAAGLLQPYKPTPKSGGAGAAFPYFKGFDTAECALSLSVDYRFPPKRMLPEFLNAALAGVFAGGGSAGIFFCRCPNSRPIDVMHTIDASLVTVHNLSSIHHIECTGRYLEALFVTPPGDALLPSLAPLQPLQTAAAVRCPTPSEAHPEAPPAPMLPALEAWNWLERESKHWFGLKPTGFIYDRDGAVTWVETIHGAVACSKSPCVDHYDRFLFVVGELLRRDERLLGECRRLVRDKAAMTDFFYRDLLPSRVAFVEAEPLHLTTFAAERLDEYVERIVDELARRHHTMCRLLGFIARVQGDRYDVFPNEHLELL